ncbi:MAG: hypothetical protein A2139_11345 [Desulfobacca sp. RBG_16_60_12]|nr:MAG: hypothetical protein A2139_11345 [Desulfobacca sp. RBG_16_60_12]
MFWTLWDLFALWNFLSLGWMILYAALFMTALALVVMRETVLAPFKTRARETVFHPVRHKEWVEQMEKRLGL